MLELFFERNERALKDTEEKYGRLCRALAQNVLGSAEDAEECANDVYLTVWNTVPPTKPDNLKVYICRITRNLALKKLEYYAAQKRSAGINLYVFSAVFAVVLRRRVECAAFFTFPHSVGVEFNFFYGSAVYFHNIGMKIIF